MKTLYTPPYSQVNIQALLLGRDSTLTRKFPNESRVLPPTNLDGKIYSHPRWS